MQTGTIPLGDLLFSPLYSYHGERRFLLPTLWWNSWCEYTNFDTYITYAQVMTSMLNKSQQHVDFVSPPCRPIPVRELLEPYGGLKTNLLETVDFVAVSGPIWRLLEAWYSSDEKIIREY